MLPLEIFEEISALRAILTEKGSGHMMSRHQILTPKHKYNSKEKG